MYRLLHLTRLGVLLAMLGAALPAAAEKLDEIRIDYAYYNPVSLVLKEKGWLEQAFAADGIKIRWVLSLGSNKALEYLNGKSIDFGSTAGAAALLGRIGGNPVKAIYVSSQPEWTALVSAKGSALTSIKDLAGKRIAVTRGTDPHIFLIRALATQGLAEKDVRLVLLQHQDGRTALLKGDVDAWAGLDPMMAQAELEDGAQLFYRNPDFNSFGILNSREDFIAEHPDIVARVLALYDRARLWALTNPAELRQIIAQAARVTPEVAARQLERTNLSNPVIGARQQDVISAAGIALQQAGVIAPEVDVKAVTRQLLEPRFSQAVAAR
jgi:sulfonate transport system substrate-binding protein